MIFTENDKCIVVFKRYNSLLIMLLYHNHLEMWDVSYICIFFKHSKVEPKTTLHLPLWYFGTEDIKCVS